MREIYNSIPSGAQFEHCADLHSHSSLSDGRMSAFKTIDIAAKVGLDTLALTDHNTSLAGFMVREYGAEKGVRVIIGAEITTSDGHIGVLYQGEKHSDIPQGRPLTWTIQAAHAQGALVMAVHPFARFVNAIGEEGSKEVITNPHSDVYFDMFEVDSALRDIPMLAPFNDKALSFYVKMVEEHPDKIGAAVGNSDNHFYGPGRSRTWYNGTLESALKKRETLVTRTTRIEDGMYIALAYAECGEDALKRPRELKERAARRQQLLT